jgi:subtilisin family serine protease
MGSAEATKLNGALRMALRTFRESEPSLRDPNDGITVTMRFTGELSVLEKLGFETHSRTGDEAMGIVRFKDIDALVAAPGVVWLASGMPRKARDTAVPDVKARVPGGGTLGTDGLWEAAVATGALTEIGNATGDGVIVAVIDTGIDYTHPMFMSQLTPTKKTRILRIWDQGLVPGALTDCPAQALLLPGGRYGVEFDAAEIETALNAGPLLPHKDCEGHGTHVAGIAAGGTVFGAGGDASKVGVAPKADIIAVKVLDVPEVIRFKLAAGMGAQVDTNRRFRDALIYCLRTARALGKPVVINESFGNAHEAGDALDDDARFVDTTMDPAHAADDNHFPSGAIVVRACGNEGDASRREFAHIVVPAGGEVTIPLALADTRGGVNNKFRRCALTLHDAPLLVSFWYRRDFDHVKFAVKLPFRSTFEGGGDMGIGGNFEDGYLLRPGAPPTLVNVAAAANQHRVTASHNGEPAVPHPNGGTVRRHSFTLLVTPKTSGGIVTYLTGTYEVRIRAPAGTEIFMAGDRENWGPALNVTLRVGTTMADGTAIPPAVDAFVDSAFTAVDTLGRHAISVAAYNDTDHKIAKFSSRGPLRDFSDPASPLPLIASKPELAAPGVKVNSAQGVDTNVGAGIRVPPWTDGVRFIELNGTSMAAPMVSGAVALMLDKNAALDTTTVRDRLTAFCRPGVDPAGPGVDHDRAYGSGMLDALETHTHT